MSAQESDNAVGQNAISHEATCKVQPRRGKLTACGWMPALLPLRREDSIPTEQPVEEATTDRPPAHCIIA
jgi:hypothetical protein